MEAKLDHWELQTLGHYFGFVHEDLGDFLALQAFELFVLKQALVELQAVLLIAVLNAYSFVALH